MPVFTINGFHSNRHRIPELGISQRCRVNTSEVTWRMQIATLNHYRSSVVTEINDDNEEKMKKHRGRPMTIISSGFIKKLFDILRGHTTHSKMLAN